MRKLAYLGVASLTAVALLGISCSSDDNPATATGGTTSATGGATSKAGGATSTGTKAGGGSSSTAPQGGAGGSTTPAGGSSSTSPAGGTTGVGGVTGTGGVTGATTSTGGSTAATDAGPPITGGIETMNGYYDSGTVMGTTWTSIDAEGSTATLAKNELCASGNVIKVPAKLLDGGPGPDYSGAWGATVGVNLNQTEGVDGGTAGPQNPADLSKITSVTIGINGTVSKTTRIQLEVKPAADAGTTASTYYCATLSTTYPTTANGVYTVPINTFKTQCWGTTGNVVFDPATMQPVSLGVSVVTDVNSSYLYNFCVTELKFNTGDQ